MIFIDKTNWFHGVFAEVVMQEDLIRRPLEDYHRLSNKEKDQLRQTQVFKHEIVQVLGVHQNFSLVRKYEQTLGWMPSHHLSPSHKTQFEIPAYVAKSAYEFLSSWKGTAYEFGGINEKGIDCSGLTQLYYLHVHDIVLPKNSHDQRKLGREGSFNALKDHDLIFCRPYTDLTFHHVAIHFENQLWHSRRKGGVVVQSAEEFSLDLKIEVVKSLLAH